jgi:pSer/pThr/pTyr-binding forkhead associated (FHA) protein
VFVIDITFQGDLSSVERIFVRRPYLTIGAPDTSHLVVNEMENLGFSLQIQRDLARSFKVTTVPEPQRSAPSLIGGTYDGRASFDLGVVKFDIAALDLDVLIRENEALDKAGIRILRRACSDGVPEFPALCVTSPMRAVLSFWPDQPLLVGRSRSASVRLDVPTVSLQHARVGYESGEFWIEDLGSTNGTFVGDKQVSSRVTVPAGTPIFISKNASVVGVTSREQLASIDSPSAISSSMKLAAETIFPSLVSIAPVARPSRVVLKPGMRVDVGRDPSCGLWLGAPHISRRHCTVEVSKTGEVRITDSSTNGTAYDGGVLRSSDAFKTSSQPTVLDFGAGVTVALCFTEEHEQTFKRAHGAPHAFNRQEGGPAAAGDQGDARARVARERRNTTWFKMDDSTLNQFRVRKGRVATVRAMCSGLTVQGRVALIVIALGFAILLGVIVWMVISGFSR